MLIAQEKATLGTYLQELPRCIGFLDGTLVRSKTLGGTRLTNGEKKIHLMNIINFDPHKPIHLHRYRVPIILPQC
jgi:hypothetical protein